MDYRLVNYQARRRATLLRVRARSSPRVKGKPTNRPVGHDGHSPVPLPLDVHTQEQLDEFLESVAQGIGPDIAALGIGSTSTKMRRLFARGPEWQAKLDAAVLQGREFYADRLKATARVIALRTEHDQVIPRILEVELATHVEGYEHLRRDRIKHEGHITHGLQVYVDPALLDELPLEKLQRARAALAELADVIDGEFTELPNQPELPAA